MARGDYVRILYRTGVGVAEEKVIARTAGASIEVDMPTAKTGKPLDPFVEVREVNKAGMAIRTCSFGTGDVVALISGHDEPKAPAKAGKKA